jgi:hypothetical protein
MGHIRLYHPNVSSLKFAFLHRMKYLFALILLAAQAYTQSAPQFEVVVAENLPVRYGATQITPGVLISRNGILASSPH